MNWLSWILAYLFDCVHPHTTWPRHQRAGFAYVACLNCGRELPYSLERMRIVTRAELLADGERGAWQRNLAPRETCALSAISQEANRGAGLVLRNFAIGTAERIGASLAQEFLFGKFTRRSGHMK